MNRFRVVFVPAVEVSGKNFTSDVVGSFESALIIRDAIANYTLLLHERDLMTDFSNIAIIEQAVDGEWVDASHLEDPLG